MLSIWGPVIWSHSSTGFPHFWSASTGHSVELCLGGGRAVMYPWVPWFTTWMKAPRALSNLRRLAPSTGIPARRSAGGMYYLFLKEAHLSVKFLSGCSLGSPVVYGKRLRRDGIAICSPSRTGTWIGSPPTHIELCYLIATQLMESLGKDYVACLSLCTWANITSDSSLQGT